LQLLLILLLRTRRNIIKGVAQAYSDIGSTLSAFGFNQRRWDEQIEADSHAGKLDFLINDALAEHNAGQSEEL